VAILLHLPWQEFLEFQDCRLLLLAVLPLVEDGLHLIVEDLHPELLFIYNISGVSYQSPAATTPGSSREESIATK
jgi:hypothetical protein